MATQAHRIKLHEELCEILGTRHVYFNPDTNVRMKFPCIIYNTSVGRAHNADNQNYLFCDSYNVTVVDQDPDSQIPDAVLKHFRKIRRGSPFIADGLHHSPFVLYY